MAVGYIANPGCRKMWDMMPEEARVQILEDTAKKLLLKHVASPDEIAEAYIFLMK